MPYPGIRLLTTALLLLSGCATPNLFSGSQGAKPNTEQAAPSGPRPSSYTSSWSGNQTAKRTSQDTAPLANNPLADNERRVQDLVESGDRSQSVGDRRAARSAYEQALRLAPGNPRANFQLAIMDDDEGRFAEAEAHYMTLRRQDPREPNILASLGWSYLLQGRYEESDRILREALQYDGNNKLALNNLGMLYGTCGDYDGALTIFRMAGSEADAQRALAMLKQNAGNGPIGNGPTGNGPAGNVPAGNVPAGNVPGSTEQYAANPTVNPANPPAGSAVGSPLDPRGGFGIAESEATSPEGRKLIRDFNRLKAEQQERQAKVAQKNLAAPSPWNNNRQAGAISGQRDAAREKAVQGLVWENGSTSIPPFGVSPVDPAQADKVVRNDASFPGDAPAQANRARQAGPADGGPVGNASGLAGNIPPFKAGAQSYPGTQTIYEQPATPRLNGQARSPVITPAGEGPANTSGNAPTWNALPRDDSYRPAPTGNNVSQPPGRLSDWPRNNPGPALGTDQSPTGGTWGGTNAGQFNGAQQRGYNSQQEAQAAAAAQLGLSAGSGGLGFPAADWPPSANGQTPIPPNGNGGMGMDNSAGSQVPAGGPFGSAGQSQPLNQNSAAGQNSFGAQTSQNTSGSGLPPWPGRPLAGGTVPQAVVPSAQGVVYGSTGDTSLPNFYSARPTISPAR